MSPGNLLVDFRHDHPRGLDRGARIVTRESPTEDSFLIGRRNLDQGNVAGNPTAADEATDRREVHRQNLKRAGLDQCAPRPHRTNAVEAYDVRMVGLEQWRETGS